MSELTSLLLIDNEKRIKRIGPVRSQLRMTNKTNLHMYGKPSKRLDCSGKLAFNGQSDFNLHIICESCGARFFYDKELGR
jgi:hypothetical protein